MVGIRKSSEVVLTSGDIINTEVAQSAASLIEELAGIGGLSEKNHKLGKSTHTVTEEIREKSTALLERFKRFG